MQLLALLAGPEADRRMRRGPRDLVHLQCAREGRPFAGDGRSIEGDHFMLKLYNVEPMLLGGSFSAHVLMRKAEHSSQAKGHNM